MRPIVQEANSDLQQALLTPAPNVVTHSLQINVRDEVKALLTLSAPVTVQLSSQYAIHVISQSFVGHQGPASLTAAAIGHTVHAYRCTLCTCVYWCARTKLRAASFKRQLNSAVVQHLLVVCDRCCNCS